MPKINWNQVDEVNLIPEGQYLMKVLSIEVKQTRSGDEMWRMRLEIKSGQYAGRCVYDNLVFTPKALGRVKLVCGKMGLPVSGETDLQPNMLTQREALVEIIHEQYEDPHGVMKKRTVVPFAGYEHATKDSQQQSSSSANEEQSATVPLEELPF